MARCEEASEKTLTTVFNVFRDQGVAIDCMILKTNMVVPGKESGEKASPEHVAEATIRVFKKTLPVELPGEAFLSGGQSEIEATQNLDAIAKIGPHPWKLTFSYGRALQESAAAAWTGKEENVAAAQAVFLKRATMNSLAAKGEYTGE
jgi:fructose-bisphosphate aldolase class I